MNEQNLIPLLVGFLIVVVICFIVAHRRERKELPNPLVAENTKRALALAEEVARLRVSVAAQLDATSDALDRLQAYQQQLTVAEVTHVQYQELLYAVVSAYPGETRHATALRYIREHEQKNSGSDQVAQSAKGKV